MRKNSKLYVCIICVSIIILLAIVLLILNNNNTSTNIDITEYDESVVMNESYVYADMNSGFSYVYSNDNTAVISNLDIPEFKYDGTEQYEYLNDEMYYCVKRELSAIINEYNFNNINIKISEVQPSRKSIDFFVWNDNYCADISVDKYNIVATHEFSDIKGLLEDIKNNSENYSDAIVWKR